MPNHKWSAQDDVIAYFLYKYGDKDLLFTIDTIGDKLGMGNQSLKSRMANFKYLETGKGLSHVAKQSETVFKEFNKAPQKEYLEVIKKILYPSNKTGKINGTNVKNR